jgi:ribonucleoside-diphosphate reductase alpha chain
MKAKSRPKELHGKTHKVQTGCGSLYVVVNLDDEGKVFEVFAKLGKSGGCSACTTEALTRTISIGLRSGVDLSEFYNTLLHISCASPTFTDGVKISSCPDAIAQVLKEYLAEGEGK